MDKQSKIEVLKECKFLQLCAHQTGVQLTLLSCIFTPKLCKYDLHTILNARRKLGRILWQYHCQFYCQLEQFSKTVGVHERDLV